MSEQVEIGQAIFGNPTGDYGTEGYQDALVEDILSEIERVYWNKNQIEWNRHDDPMLSGVTFRPYYWGDDEEKEALPNLKFDFSPQEIRWYKYPRRGQSFSLRWSAEQWVEWYNEAMKIIQSNDTRL